MTFDPKKSLTRDQLRWHESETHRAYQGGKKIAREETLEAIRVGVSIGRLYDRVRVRVAWRCPYCSKNLQSARDERLGDLPTQAGHADSPAVRVFEIPQLACVDCAAYREDQVSEYGQR